MGHRPDPLDRDEIVAHASFVRGVARGILVDAAAADDVAQETLLKLLKAAPARALRPASIRAWLARAVRNLAIQWRLADVRRAKREEESASREALPATDALVQRIELHRRVVDAALALDEGQRAVVLLHYFDGLSMAELAQRLVIPLETARTRLKRALSRLRTRLEAEEGGAERLLLALLPVAGIDAPVVAIAAASTTAAAAAGGAAGVATPIGASIVLTSVGKLSLAAAPLVAVGAWWLLHAAPLGSAHEAGDVAVVERHLAADRTADGGLAPVSNEQAARTSDSPRAPADEPPEIDAALAAEGLGTVRVHVVCGTDHSAAPAIGVRVVPEAEPRAITNAVRGSTNAEGLFIARRVRAGWCAAALAGFDTLPHWRWDHPETSGSGDDRAETPAGCNSIAFKLAPGATRDVELGAPEDCSIDGRVVDPDQRPVAGASIWVSDLEQTPIYGESGALIGLSTVLGVNGQFVATSDADGRFELRSIGHGCGVAAMARGFAMSQLHQLFGAAVGRSSLTIRLERPGTTVAGRVVAASGAAIEGAVVTIDLVAPPPREFADGVVRLDPAPRRERSGRDGRFVFEGVALAPARLVAAAAGFAPTITTIDPSPATANELGISLEAGGTLTGSVRDESGAPVAAVDVTITPEDFALARNLDAAVARSDANGDFRIEHLAAAPLVASIDDPRRGRATTSLSLRSGETSVWNAVLSRGRILRGRVVDERGAPLDHWQVAAVRLDGQGGRDAERLAPTDRDGRFEFGSCGDFDYEVSARHPEATSFALSSAVTARPAGGEVLLRVLDAELPKCWIFGSLRVPDGFSTNDALFDVRRLDGAGSITTMAGVTPERFQSGPYPAGRYALALRISRLPPRDLGIHELKPGGELDLGEIVFERPARVVVHARHADGTAAEAKELCIVSRDSPDRIELKRDGASLESAPLEPGRYLLLGEASAPECVWQPFECAAGQRLELTVALEPAALRLFRFTSAARAPDRVTIRCFDESDAEQWSQIVAPDARGALELRARFTVGRWSLEATASDRSRAEFEVDVESLDDDGAARAIALH